MPRTPDCLAPLLLYFLAIGLLAATAACGGNEGNPSAEKPSVTAAVPAAATQALPPASPPPQSDNGMQAELDADPRLPGVYYPPHPGADGVYGTGDDRLHVGDDVIIPICTPAQLAAAAFSDPLCYTSNPPASGPHNSPADFGVLLNAAPKEALVHNMEHGGVVVWYNTDDTAVIEELAAIVNIDRRSLVVMSQYTEMEPDTIALTAWTRLDKFPVSDFERKRVTDFVAEHLKRFNPEGF